MEKSKENKLGFFLLEFDKLKDEQQQRIGFRDNMIFITLGSIGAVFSFALENPKYNIALLVLPFICITLGWTYLANDQKISAIGKYLKNVLIPKISNDTNSWEDYLGADKRRRGRKWIQLFIDLSIFCFSGILSLIAFFILRESLSVGFKLILFLEVFLLILLGYQFIKYADI